MLTRRLSGPVPRAGLLVDVPEIGAEVLHHFEPTGQGELRLAHGQALDHRGVRVRERGVKRLSVAHHVHRRRVESRDPGTHAIEPSVEIGDVDREVVGERGAAFGRCLGVKDDLDRADDHIILGDDDRHGVTRSPTCSVCVIVLRAP